MTEIGIDLNVNEFNTGVLLTRDAHRLRSVIKSNAAVTSVFLLGVRHLELFLLRQLGTPTSNEK